ncbi:GspH/FimT family pseudopilin [Kinneretia aquatilis]|uniref:GspH/FimT family pseudopilin n=1 Tax=Kinneretia aquatilis TaxID=2070761 RepID=UPI0014952C42|nr:GspH/FimT family pseudopilin [Paucibacter aquatile]WIV99958.1 GspH/FimT family pseudopilin [Paucibacter aquatile]
MKHKRNGVTLVELMVVLVILGVLAALATPSMADMWNKRRVAAVANEIATDLAFARSEAVAKGVNILIQYKKNSSMSCYTVHHKATMGDCNCLSATAVCDETTSGIEVKTVQIPSNLDVTFVSTSASGDPVPLVEYTFPHFTPNPANFSVEVTGRNAVSMQVQVNAMGRIKTCSPNGTMPGVAAC